MDQQPRQAATSRLGGTQRCLTRAGLLALVPLLVACSGGGASTPKPAATAAPTSKPASPASPSPQPVAAASSSLPVAAAQPAAAAPSSVQIVASELKFEPNTVAVKAGQVQFVVQNGGAIEHNFVVEDATRKELGKIANIEVQKTEQVSVSLQAGAYMMVCTLPGHREAGMVGTINVAG